MNFDKEHIYDQEVALLVSQIIEICKSKDIPMVASFCYKVSDDYEEVCTTFIPQSSGWAPESFSAALKQLRRNQPLMAFTITKSRSS